MKRMKYILIFTAVSSLFGCSSSIPPPYKAYQGEKKLSDLAIIQSEGTYIWIMTIDGKTTLTDFDSFIGLLRFPEQVLAEPGRHTFEVRFVRGTGSAEGKLWLDAAAGKTYIVRKEIKGYNIRFWIEDKESGKVVGGNVRGGEPKPEK